MKNGRHAHYCPICKTNVECPKVTHCQEPDTMICLYNSHDREALEAFMAQEDSDAG